MNHKNWFLAVTFICLISPACSKGGAAVNTNAPATAPTKAAAPVAVITAPVVSESVEKRVELTGTLAAWEEGVVSIEAEGRLVRVMADLGDKVKRGAALAQIAPQEYEFRKAQTQADLAAAESDFTRISSLAEQGGSTRAQLDESRRRLEVSRTAADLAVKKLSDATLRAPFTGIVDRRMINLGEYVRIGAPAFNVVSISPLKFKGEAPERFSLDVKIGNPVEAHSDSYPGRTLTGKVSRVSPTVSISSRSFAVEAEIDNPDEAVKPGAFARLSILTGSVANALTVPDSALADFAGNPRVFVVEGGKAVERVVEIGGRFKDKAIISKGLKAGELVVAAGVEQITDGMPVVARKE